MGSSIYRNLTVTTTGASVVAGPATLMGWYIANQATTARYLKLYNSAAVPTSSDTPVMTVVIPASAAANVQFGSLGVDFSAGIGVRASTVIADNDATAPTANDVVVNLFYKAP